MIYKLHTYRHYFFINSNISVFSSFMLHLIICAMLFVINFFLNTFSVVIKISQPFKLCLHCTQYHHSLILFYFLSPCFYIDSILYLCIHNHNPTCTEKQIIHSENIYSENCYIFELRNQIIYFM